MCHNGTDVIVVQSPHETGCTEDEQAHLMSLLHPDDRPVADDNEDYPFYTGPDLYVES